MPSPQGLHLLWITENYPPSPGGMAVSCDRIIRGLRGQGVTVDIAHLSHSLSGPRDAVQQQGRYFGCPVGDDPAHALNLLSARLSCDAHRDRYTHLVAFGGNLPILAGPTLAAWMGIPLVTLLRGNDFDTAVFSPQRSGPLLEALRRSDRICAVSRDKQARIDALRPGASTEWIPNGIDLDDWSLFPSDKAAAKAWRDREVTSGKRVLGLFGQIKPKKGGLHLVESLKHSGAAERIHLLLAGDVDPAILDALLSTAPAAPAARNISHTLHPFGDRYGLLRHYASCDAVAIPSYYDGTPNVLLEAMGLGIPLVASTAGGMGDLLEDGVHGFLFHPGDPHGCRTALDRFADTSHGILAEMGASCLVRAREYPPARETRAYLETFQSIRRNIPRTGDSP